MLISKDVCPIWLLLQVEVIYRGRTVGISCHKSEEPVMTDPEISDHGKAQEESEKFRKLFISASHSAVVLRSLITGIFISMISSVIAIAKTASLKRIKRSS